MSNIPIHYPGEHPLYGMIVDAITEESIEAREEYYVFTMDDAQLTVPFMKEMKWCDAFREASYALWCQENYESSGPTEDFFGDNRSKFNRAYKLLYREKKAQMISKNCAMLMGIDKTASKR